MRATALLLCVLAVVFFTLTAGVSFAVTFGIQILVDAYNPETLECKTFGAPMHVPAGWVIIDSCENVPDLTLVNQNLTFSNSDVQTLSLNLKKWADVSSFKLYLRGYKQNFAEYKITENLRPPDQSPPLNEKGNDYAYPNDQPETLVCETTQYDVYCGMKDYLVNVGVELGKFSSAKLVVKGKSVNTGNSNLFYFVNKDCSFSGYDHCEVYNPSTGKCITTSPSDVNYRCSMSQWGMRTLSAPSVCGGYVGKKSITWGSCNSNSDCSYTPNTCESVLSGPQCAYGICSVYVAKYQSSATNEIPIPLSRLKQGYNVFSFGDNRKDRGSLVESAVLRLDSSGTYPSDTKIDFGRDGFFEAIAQGEVGGLKAVEIPIGTVREALENCEENEEGVCTISVSFSPGSIGILNILGYELKEKEETLDGAPEGSIDLGKNISFSGKSETLFLNLPKGKVFETFELYLNSQPKNFIEYKLSGELNPAAKSSINGHCEDNLDNYCDYSDFNITIDKSKISSVGLVINAEALTNSNGNLFYFLNRECSVVGQSYICGGGGGEYHPEYQNCREHSDCRPYKLGACESILDDRPSCSQIGKCIIYVSYSHVIGSYPTYDCTYTGSGSLQFPFGGKTVEVPISLSTLKDGLNNISVAEDAHDGILMYVNYIGLKTYVPPNYISDVSVDFGNDGKDDFLYGTQTGWVKVSIPAETVNEYLENCEGEESCEVPIVFSSSTIGTIEDIALYAQEEPLFTPVSNPFVLAAGEGGAAEDFGLAGDVTAFAQENPLLSLLLLGGAAAVGVSLARRGSVGDWIEKLNPRTSQEIEAESQPVKSFEQKFAESKSKFWKEAEKARLEREQENRRQASLYRAQRRAETNAKWAALGLFPKPEPEPQLEIVRNPNSIYFPRPELPQVQTVTIEPKAIPVTITPETVFSAEPVEQGFWGGLWNKAKGKLEGAKKVVGDAWNGFKEVTKTYENVPVIGGILNGAVQAGEFTYGVGKSVYNTVKGLVYDLPKAGYTWATTSEDHWGDIKSGAAYVADGVSWVASHPAETGQKLKELGQQAWSYCSGSAMNAGECVGEVAQLFVGGGAVGAAGKAGKAANIANKAGKVAKGAGKIGKGIDGAADIGKVGSVAGKLGNSAKLVEGATLAGSKGGKVQFPAIFKEATKYGDDYATSLKVLKVEPAPKSLGKSASNIAKSIDKEAFPGYKINVVYADVGKETGKIGKVSSALNIVDEETKTITILLDKGTYKYSTESAKKIALKHELMHPMLFKSDEPWKAMGLKNLPPEVKEHILKNLDETIKPLQSAPVKGLPKSEYLVDYANLKLAQDSKYFSFLTNTKYKGAFPNGATKETMEAFLKGKVEEIVADSTKRVGSLPSWAAGLPGISGKAGHAGLPVIGIPRIGGGVRAAAPAVKIPAKVESILVNGERVAVSGIEKGLLKYKIVPITNGQKGHLGMLRGEIGKGARTYNAKLESIQYGDFGKRERWASTFYDTLHLDQKVSAAEMLRRGTISHEFAHMEIAQKRFASREGFKNRPRAFKESYLSEAEADALIRVREGKGVFRNRVELLVGESEAHDAAKLLDGVRLSKREVENVIANELLALRTGDAVLMGRAQKVSKLLVDRGLITKEEYAQIQTSMNNWLRNTIDKGRIGSEADAMKVQEKLMGF